MFDPVLPRIRANTSRGLFDAGITEMHGVSGYRTCKNGRRFQYSNGWPVSKNTSDPFFFNSAKAASNPAACFPRREITMFTSTVKSFAPRSISRNRLF